ncbi:MAG: tRNA preQ1(34) S-adenosylmethionine ribosyltransferase-isomerase QueA [Chloroflexi bacterium]|nr:tRNA preQ1(34) S-adenosylmethionine ribosyltransferase-isomerase QueA [Chloroflexota bacterium]
MDISDFDYDLPPELIAQTPLPRRDDSRLLVVERHSGCLRHHSFRDLPSLLKPGDVIVFNDSRVLPARLRAHKPTGGKVELLLVEPRADGTWSALTRPGLPRGAIVYIGDSEPSLPIEVIGLSASGLRIVRTLEGMSVATLLAEYGELPTPPYIHRRLSDPSRYQTIYARESGSIAAPTAGLHFTEEILEQLDQHQVEIQYLTLHVGIGTFTPVRVQEVARHHMHEEHFTLSEPVARALERAKRTGRRIIAVGTTTTRALESAWHDGGLRTGIQSTSLFITPGFQFHVIDALVTNFHLPRSTLLMLVSAFTGHELIMRAYHEAISQRYRFYSFGDAMFIT